MRVHLPLDKKNCGKSGLGSQSPWVGGQDYKKPPAQGSNQIAGFGEFRPLTNLEKRYLFLFLVFQSAWSGLISFEPAINLCTVFPRSDFSPPCPSLEVVTNQVSSFSFIFHSLWPLFFFIESQFQPAAMQRFRIGGEAKTENWHVKRVENGRIPVRRLQSVRRSSERVTKG